MDYSVDFANQRCENKKLIIKLKKNNLRTRIKTRMELVRGRDLYEKGSWTDLEHRNTYSTGQACTSCNNRTSLLYTKEFLKCTKTIN